MAEIPKIPLREIPESGYRLIRDELINLFRDRVDESKTASSQVIDIMRRFCSPFLVVVCPYCERLSVVKDEEPETWTCPQCDAELHGGHVHEVKDFRWK